MTGGTCIAFGTSYAGDHSTHTIRVSTREVPLRAAFGTHGLINFSCAIADFTDVRGALFRPRSITLTAGRHIVNSLAAGAGNGIRFRIRLTYAISTTGGADIRGCISIIQTCTTDFPVYTERALLSHLQVALVITVGT